MKDNWKLVVLATKEKRSAILSSEHRQKQKIFIGINSYLEISTLDSFKLSDVLKQE